MLRHERGVIHPGADVSLNFFGVELAFGPGEPPSE